MGRKRGAETNPIPPASNGEVPCPRVTLMNRRPVLALWLLGVLPSYAEEPPALVPWPQSVEIRSGTLPLGPLSRIVVADEELRPLAQVMSEEIDLATGLVLDAATSEPKPGDIRCEWTSEGGAMGKDLLAARVLTTLPATPSPPTVPLPKLLAALDVDGVRRPLVGLPGEAAQDPSFQTGIDGGTQHRGGRLGLGVEVI